MSYQIPDASAAAVNPTLPQSTVDTTYPTLPSGHKIWNVNTSCTGITNCFTTPQAAVNAASPGDEVVIKAGQEFTGQLSLPAKTCSLSNQSQCWIVIRTSNLSSLPPAGNRVSPADAVNMPKLTGTTTAADIKAAVSSSYYRIVGIEITKDVPTGSVGDLVTLGTNDTSQTTLAQVPSHMIMDRDYIHGDTTNNYKRGVNLNSNSSAVIDSYISNIHTVGQDTQAIASFNAPGPFKISNNYLEAAAENVLFGGDDPKIPNLVPSDIEVKNNYFYKPRSWRVADPSYAGIHWSVKNIFELKNAQRVIVDSNIFDGVWLDGQPGFAIVLTVRNQSGGCPWCVVQDVTFQNNIVRHAGGGVNILGHDDIHPPSALEQRIKVYNNLWEDISSANWGGLGIFAQMASGTSEIGPSNIQLIHNTVNQTGTFVAADLFVNSLPITKENIVITDNAAPHNTYGVKGQSVAVGNATLDGYFPGIVFTKNILTGQRSSTDTRNWSGVYTSYAGNFFPIDWSTVMVNQAAGNYHMITSSVYHNAGTDGKDIGADLDSVSAATANVLTGKTTGGGVTPLVGDINLDHIVNSLDYSILNSHWFTSDATSDLNHDGFVNAIDFSTLNKNWLGTW